MRELSTYKKQKAVKLFLEGLAYDEIAEELGNIAAYWVRINRKGMGILL